MAYLLLAIIVAAVATSAIRRLSIPQIDDDVASEVILGVKHDDGSRLPPIFLDRGGAIDAPENTLAAFREAKKQGAFGVVFELSFTWDNIAVIFHGETLERTTNGKGPLSEIRFDDLRQLDAAHGHRFAQRFRGERVPNLEEGVEECLRLGMRIIIDVKKHDSRIVGVIDQIFHERPELYMRALVTSVYPDIVYDLRALNPRIVTALTWRPGLLAYEDTKRTLRRFESLATTLMATVADWLYEKILHVGLLPYVTGVSAVVVSSNALSAEYVCTWRSHGVRVISWASNHPDEKNFFRNVLRVPIITDSTHLE
ncbi:glycerophosphodiester phosphodiesterase 1-like [Rhipicephalus microplus]|uniref:glycerophosphodiester phosphodiesterase 1-like n=1 Tax=Rhipicephalus microplus TaxID=6941 RepID=UPI003F6CEA05